ncbi:MAG: hypothetical protein A2X13_15045 [Bacteroidetes bacterium GWC2_33_15]|nr:MAG: hypothetical protein A2X10_07110 [Bacteroidetes bacterium GWA2_33_15]OFX50186.1 MAG: hypothetical protein A2X13_15045 [Bacteroidetes bacterium GWC2_33_15]OFX65338.1 MAG: hypothetical protein A2X15_04620 [Bacteroidetes bacterium GWB2_32_14]OFX70565.1 MAG: hypothetical protein A2X14_04675 [Bacteroidetes bacterium GWD2_33_33]HAN19561.1 hypothetical protein [Bacteroidales bacterium]
MSTGKEVEIIEIFAGTTWQTAIVKSLLENAGIKAFLKDGILGTLTPWWTSPGGASPIKIFISNADYENAKLIVEEYEKNLKAGN